MWIDNIETKINKYKMFETKENKTLKVLIVYVDGENEISKVKKSKIKLNNENLVSKEELANLLIANKQESNISYNSYKMMNFNLTVKPLELENFMESELGEDAEYTNITNNFSTLTDIKLKNSINMFENLNMLMIILRKRTTPSQNHTKSKKTKPVICNVKNRKTRKCLNIK